MQFNTASLFPLIVIGSLYFAVYGAFSLVALPVSLIKDFLSRPTMPQAETLVLAKESLKLKSVNLLERGKEMYNKNREIDMLADDKTKGQ